MGTSESQTSDSVKTRAVRGCVYGLLTGVSLLAFGLVSFGIAVLIGVEHDTSLEGLEIIGPLYLLSWAGGGAATGALWHLRKTFAGALLAGTAGAAVLIPGIALSFFLAFEWAEPTLESICMVPILVLMFGAGIGHVTRRT